MNWWRALYIIIPLAATFASWVGVNRATTPDGGDIAMVAMIVSVVAVIAGIIILWSHI